MATRHFQVRAVWDDEAGAYICESDIIGLHVEAGTLDEFERAVLDCAAELIVANHLSPADLASRPLRDLIPAIIWREPLRLAVS
jgi:hypothetical protein